MCPKCQICSPVSLYILWDIGMFCGQDTSWGAGGWCQHVCQAFGVCQYIHWMSIMLHNVNFYVSSFYYHGYDYYSSSDCSVFWCVVYVIGDCGSLFVGVAYNVESAQCGSAATPDTKILWRCSWPSLHVTAANSIFFASSGLCQLCHGSSTGGFLFQSWASHHFVCYMFGVRSGVCFLLSGALLDAIFTTGGSTIGVCTPTTLWSSPMAGICATWWWSSVHTKYAQSGCSLYYIE